MDVTTLEAPQRASLAEPSAQQVPASPGRVAPGRPRRRSGRGTGPQARPARPVAAAPLPLAPSRSCAAATPAAQQSAASSWRLTDRGIALVLVTALVIVTAALTVVGLTAVRVTGDHVAEHGQTVLLQP